MKPTTTIDPVRYGPRSPAAYERIAAEAHRLA